MKNQIKEYKTNDDEKHIWLKVDNKNKNTFYYLRGRQASFVPVIKFEGFVGLPVGFYLSKRGFGFSGSTKGYYFLDLVTESIDEEKQVELIVTKSGNNSFREYKNKAVIKIQAKALKNLITKLKNENQRNNDAMKEEISSFLSSVFPKKIQTTDAPYNEYKGGDMVEVLNRNGIEKNLNEEDLKAVLDFFPNFFGSSVRGRKGILTDLKIRLAKEGKKITDKVFLDEVISEFRLMIKKKSAKEEDWQIFLREKVFPFLTNYTKIIDKENIGVDISYPDFVLVDVYGFADIFEIKTHLTDLLSYDKDHDNYFWHREISKAISQVENYSETIKENESSYARLVKKKYGLDLRVMRTKTFIVAGTSNQLSNETALEDFKRLRTSHKNIDFILYDELLANLEGIQSKLEKSK